jgi:hypothetical protein
MDFMARLIILGLREQTDQTLQIARQAGKAAIDEKWAERRERQFASLKRVSDEFYEHLESRFRWFKGSTEEKPLPSDAERQAGRDAYRRARSQQRRRRRGEPIDVILTLGRPYGLTRQLELPRSIYYRDNAMISINYWKDLEVHYYNCWYSVTEGRKLEHFVVRVVKGVRHRLDGRISILVSGELLQATTGYVARLRLPMLMTSEPAHALHGLLATFDLDKTEVHYTKEVLASRIGLLYDKKHRSFGRALRTILDQVNRYRGKFGQVSWELKNGVVVFKPKRIGEIPLRRQRRSVAALKRYIES